MIKRYAFVFKMGICCSRDENDYKYVISQCKSKNEKFIDKKFPPEPSSLINDWNSNDPDVLENKEEWKKIEWIRATEIPELNDDEGQLKVFADKIEPNDIKQGGLGDCYFLSVLSCTAERQKRIRKLFN